MMIPVDLSPPSLAGACLRDILQGFEQPFMDIVEAAVRLLNISICIRHIKGFLNQRIPCWFAGISGTINFYFECC